MYLGCKHTNCRKRQEESPLTPLNKGGRQEAKAKEIRSFIFPEKKTIQIYISNRNAIALGARQEARGKS
ncbi:hypothetical protein BJP34_35280 [Moorena producens PAL-8-15-08-1]|uniref:Uncharacterized protein n=1 Tax=Moorena producens PAL-8-15-08-1 TaxID=1458985 RepID=A0A1D8U2B6_9CYAN|nr:hypothetical protein BJP34_35280 [Moorena producens PAL-8-15-08-1]